mgnify:CR=1 FL=1
MDFPCELAPRIEFPATAELLPTPVRLDHSQYPGGDAIGRHRIVVQQHDACVGVRIECAEIAHVAGDDDSLRLTGVRQDISLVVGSLGKGVADVLDISPKSVSERLRRGQTNLVTNSLAIGYPDAVGVDDR